MRHTTTAVLLTAVCLTAGCSSDDGGGKPTVTKTTTAMTPSPSPSPSASGEQLVIGDSVTIDFPTGERITATARAYKDRGITGLPEMLSSGQRWAVLDVKVCNTGRLPIGASPFPWSLAYEDGARVEAAGMNAGELPQPLYPMDAKVRGGDCVRGHIAFQVPVDGRPERVLYSPDGVDEPVEWLVGK